MHSIVSRILSPQRVQQLKYVRLLFHFPSQNLQHTDSQTQNIANMNIETSGPTLQQTDSQTQNNIDTMDESIHQDSPFFTYNPHTSLPIFSKEGTCIILPLTLFCF